MQELSGGMDCSSVYQGSKSGYNSMKTIVNLKNFEIAVYFAILTGANVASCAIQVGEGWADSFPSDLDIMVTAMLAFICVWFCIESFLSGLITVESK